MNNDYIRDKILEVMKEKGITVNMLADQTGIPTATIYHWFDVHHNNSFMKYLDKISTCLGVSMDYIVGNNVLSLPKDDVAVYLDELKNRSEMRMLFKAAKGATKEDIEDAAKIIEMFKRKSK